MATTNGKTLLARHRRGGIGAPDDPTFGGCLITAELANRFRPPDHAAENRALLAMADALAGSPADVLQALSEAAIAVTGGESAGVSVLELEKGRPVFRWRAIAGPLAGLAGSTMPRDPSPCGVVLDTGAIQLFDQADRYFADLRGTDPPLHENLLSPFRVAGRPVGTLWAIGHRPEIRFDAEHARQLSSLARFAASALQVVAARSVAEDDLSELESLRDRQAVLLGEIEHRGRNLLGVVGAIAERTIGRGGALADFQERLAALGRVQGLLSRPQEGVEIGGVIRAELSPYLVDGPGRVVVEGPTVPLRCEQVQAVALAIHELTTNAVKYGALKQPGGRLCVRWSIAPGAPGAPIASIAPGGRHAVIDWTETGITVPAEALDRRGYGRELIERFLATLDARTTYDLGPAGLACRIEVPLG